jgi:putative oxidoreductase
MKTSLFGKFYHLLTATGLLLQSPLLLAVRLYWGWQFFLTGRGKLTHLERTAAFFHTLHIPFPAFSACLAGATECFGGLLLLVGLGSRLISIPLMFVLVVAYLTTDLEVVKNTFHDPDKFVTATPFLFLLAVCLVFVFGPGMFSLDWLIARKFQSKPPPEKS